MSSSHTPAHNHKRVVKLLRIFKQQSIMYIRQALLKLHINDQLVTNCNDSCRPCFMLVIVRHEYSMLKFIFDKDVIQNVAYCLSRAPIKHKIFK